jgi:hypothetical protein
MAVELARGHRILAGRLGREETDFVTLVSHDPTAVTVGIDPGSAPPLPIVRRRLRALVGDLPVRIVAAPPARRHLNKQDHYDKPPGGVQIVATGAQAGAGSICVVARNVNLGVIGVVTAGHVVENLGADVFQPRDSKRNDWKIGQGTVVVGAGGRAKSDSAFVTLTDPSVPTGLIWKSSKAVYTVGGIGVAHLGLTVAMQGASTKLTERTGEIGSLKATVKFDDGGILDDQMLANYLSQHGDSGAPVYVKGANDTVTLVGLNVGAALVADITSGAPDPTQYPPIKGTYAVISPWARVSADLGGLTL